MLSEFEQMHAASPGRSDAAVVVAMVQETLRDLDLSPPVDHNIVASYRGVLRIDYADHVWAGYIAPAPYDAGLVISVRSSDPWGRQRFTIFHEVLHTYMQGFYLQPQYRCEPGARPVGTEHDPELEALCDQGAAEMLMPREAFLADLEGNSLNLTLVDDLADRYEASRAATASRICALSPSKTLYVSFSEMSTPRDPFSPPKLRVESCFSRGDWSYVPRFKSVKPGGVFDRAWNGELVDETVYLDELTRNPLGWAHVSARRSDYVSSEGVQMRVKALITQIDSVGRRGAS
ncbi:ImmA/IrrE family metallo-endopeptidase [Mycolicibacterium sphagni]|nr:ImmA/IrrE family metallo-endopeptidase [Mycolicibacterium sphagni]